MVLAAARDNLEEGWAMIFKRGIGMLLAGLAIVPATAQPPGSRQTREFIQAAGESDTFETMEARTALAQSSDPQVIAFAQQMIRDHGETTQRLEHRRHQRDADGQQKIVDADRRRKRGEGRRHHQRHSRRAIIRHGQKAGQVIVARNGIEYARELHHHHVS
jgi:predicted outer membrane protein